MKRHLIIALLVSLVGVFSAKAQTEDTDTKPMFGIKAAFDINIPGNWNVSDGSVKMFRQGKGFTLGGVYNIYLGKGFYVEPGLSYFYDSYSYYEMKITDSAGNVVSEDPSLYKTGLRLPVVAGYSFGLTDNYSMSVFTGPEFSWAIDGKIRVKHKGEFPDKLFDGAQRRVDCAWKIGLGIPYNGFFISMDAAIGLTDLMKNPDLSFRENRVAVALTYYF